MVKTNSRFIVKHGAAQKIDFLTKNLAAIPNQRFVDDLEDLEKFHKRFGELTPDQERYVDIMVDSVKRYRR